MLNRLPVSVQITLPLLVIAVGMLVAGYFINTKSLDDALRARERERLNAAVSVFVEHLEEEQKSLRSIASLASRNGKFQEAFRGYVRDASSADVLGGVLEGLFDELDAGLIMAVDERGRVVGSRSRTNTLKVGADVSALWSVSDALNGEPSVSLFIHRGKWHLSAAEPLLMDGSVLGVLVVGVPVDDSFATHMVRNLGVDISLSTRQNIIATSYAGRMRTFDRDIIMMLFDHADKDVFVNNDDARQMYLYKSIKIVNEEFALIIDTDTSEMSAIQDDKTRELIRYSVLAFVLVFIIGGVLASAFNTPLRGLTLKAVAVRDLYAAGASPVPATGNEIEVLVSAIDAMVDALDKQIKAKENANKEILESRESLQNLSAHLITIREEERRAISGRVHNDLGQMLTALRMDILNLKEGDAHALVRSVDQMIGAVQELTSELRPSLLEDLGLAVAMQWHAEEFLKKAGIECEMDIDDSITVPGDIAQPLYWVFVEALTNVVRHAGAAWVEITLRATKDELTLEVEDDGRGITPEALDSSRSFGIMGMEEVLRPVGCSLNISGLPGGGTFLKVTVSLEGKQDDTDA